jgi:hypothetical protein
VKRKIKEEVHMHATMHGKRDGGCFLEHRSYLRMYVGGLAKIILFGPISFFGLLNYPSGNGRGLYSTDDV